MTDTPRLIPTHAGAFQYPPYAFGKGAAAMKRRTLLFACPLALLAGCGNSVTIPLDVSNIADAIVGALTKFAPPAVGAQLTDLLAKLRAGGDWKATLRALVDAASAVLATGVVPEPYASYARVAMQGLGLFLPSAGAASGVTIEQARGAAEMLRGMR